MVGAGGHALVAIEVLLASGHPVAGALSHDGRAHAPLDRAGTSVIGRDRELPALLSTGPGEVFVAIGDNRARRRFMEMARTAGARLVTAVSPDAVVSPSAQIAAGALIMPGALVNAAARIEAGVIINTGAIVDHECVIGPYAHIAPGVALAGNVQVGEGALLGIGARVIPGRRIGAWAVVGAGAVVLLHVADGVTVVGVPARPIATGCQTDGPSHDVR